MSEFNFCIYIDGCPFYSESYNAGSVATVFQENENHRYMRPYSETSRKNSLVYGSNEDEAGDEEEDQAWAYELRSSAQILKERLDLMGFSVQRARTAFNEVRDEHRQLLNSLPPKVRQLASLGIPRYYTFKNWSAEVSEAITCQKPLSQWAKDKEAQDRLFPCLAFNYQVTRDSYIVFDPMHVLDILRATLDMVNPNAEVVLDYTEQMQEDFFEEGELITGKKPKSLILTEGSSDCLILNETMRALYPHLHEYFHFMDFDSTHSAGGAGVLVNNLKAFIGSGIRNHIIAVFDNDTAATDALRGLDKVILPDNIKILQLPELKIARKYPTLGPQGNRFTNINGLACSIELYFGSDVLMNDIDSLTPVQWTGFNKTLKRYQGEIEDKNILQEKYMRKVRDVLEHPDRKEAYDWSAMHTLFKSIFNMFVPAPELY